MKKFTLCAIALAAVTTISACKQATKGTQDDSKALSAQAIEVHDEIMPQVSAFDQHSVLIDSLLSNLTAVKTANPALDTLKTRQELATLKDQLESATDKMMSWMYEYVTDSTDTDYQRAEVKRITALKAEFEKVNTDASRILEPFNK